MDYAEVTKHSTVRYAETDYSDDTSVTNTDLPTVHSDLMLSKLAQFINNSWQY